MENQVTLTIDSSMKESLDGLATLIRQGSFRNPDTAPALARHESYFGDPRVWSRKYWAPNGISRAYIHPSAAKQMGDAAKAYLGAGGLKAFAEPGLKQVHVDSVLTEISVAPGPTEFIGPALFPRVQVDKVSDIFFVFDKKKERRDHGTDLIRGLSARARRVGWDISQDTYKVERYTAENEIDDLVRRNADSPIDVDRRGTQVAVAALDIRLEKEIAALAFTAASWTNSTTLAGATQWSDPGSNVFGNFSTARLAIIPIANARPNTLLMGIQVFESLALSDILLERVKYSGTSERPSAVTARIMAELFQVDRVLIGAAVENTAPETLPDTETNAFIWGKHALLAYVSPSPAREDPSAGYVFTMGRVVDRYREENITSDIIRANEEWVVKKTFAGAGYLWVNATA